MAPPSHPVCSPRSPIQHQSSVLSSRPLPAFPFSVTRPQAVPLSRVLSQTRLFSPAPYFRRTEALTRSAPLREGLTEQWPHEQWPNIGCTQECPLDPAAAGAPRLRPGAVPSQKMFARQCSSSVSGIMGTRLLRQRPYPSTSECGRLSGFAGSRWLQQPLPNVLPAVEPLLPVWPENLPDPLCSWGFALPTRAPPGMELQSCSLCAPLVYSLNGIKPSPFSLFSFVPAAVSNFPLSLQLLLGRGAFPVFFPPPQSLSSLFPQKQFPTLRGFSLPKFTSLCCVPAEFCGSGCEDGCVNPPISFLGV